jgi:hypothetical protein
MGNTSKYSFLLSLGTKAWGELSTPKQSASILLYIHPRLIIWFPNNLVLWCEVVSLTPNPQTWRTRVFLFVWLLLLDLSSMGDPTSSYATAGIGALKPDDHNKMETPLVGTSKYIKQNGEEIICAIYQEMILAPLFIFGLFNDALLN